MVKFKGEVFVGTTSGVGLIHVCTCGGNCFPRGASKSGHVLQSIEICNFLAGEDDLILNIVMLVPRTALPRTAG